MCMLHDRYSICQMCMLQDRYRICQMYKGIEYVICPILSILQGKCTVQIALYCITISTG